MRKIIVSTGACFGIAFSLCAQNAPIGQALSNYEHSPRLTSAGKSEPQLRAEMFESNLDLLTIGLQNQNRDLVFLSESRLKDSMRELVFTPAAAGESHEKRKSLFHAFEGFSFWGAEENITKARLGDLRQFLASMK
jgi:hypothetical protein